MDSTVSDRSSSNSSPVSFEGIAEASSLGLPLTNSDSTKNLEMESTSNEEMNVSSPNKDVEEPQDGVSVDSTSSGAGMATGIDNLLTRHRNEIMFELRRLQLGDRPVTGQGNKEAVETFFSRALNTGTSQEPSDQHRPESVVVEVNALVERRPVQALLASARFRRNIESALIGAIRNLPPSTSTNSSAQGGARPRTRATTVNHDTSRPAENVPATSGIPAPPPIPTEQALQSTERPVQQPMEQQLQQQRQQLHRPSQQQTQQQPNQAQQQNPSQERAAWAQQWVHQELPEPSDMEQRTLGELMEDARQEDFISDISELVQRQLVTSSLESNFRQNLERLMRNHLEHSGTDGQRVQEFLRTLPRTDLQRNDFSHLGIGGVQQGSLSDDISVISATAAVTVPYAQSNAAMSREMAALKSQVSELKNMMRLSFDLQLDIQRAIRQEVAAAISSALTDGAQPSNIPASPAANTRAPPRSQPASESHCLICLERSVDSVLYQCGHMCVCHSCGLNLRTRGAHCPVCRAPIRDIIRAYKCNPDE